MRPKTRLAVAVPLLALVPLGAAHAVTVPTIYVWEGKTKHTDSVSLYQSKGAKRVQINVGVTCKKPEGGTFSYELAGDGKAKGTTLNATIHKAYNGTAGTLHVSARIKPGSKATGKVSWKLPASYGDCSGKDKLNLKFMISHGG